MINKHTPALKMFKAKMSGKSLVMFFNDNKTFEMKPMNVKSGIIEDDEKGAFVVNSEGSYLDKDNKIVVIPFSSSIGFSMGAKFSNLSDSMKKMLGDESKLAEIRKKIFDGSIEQKYTELFHKYAEKRLKEENINEIDKERLRKIYEKSKLDEFHFLRESINFSSAKSLMNSITPQNVYAKINLTLSRKLKSFGGDTGKYMMMMFVGGLAILAIFAFIVFQFKQGNTTVVREVAVNASNIIS
jgi:hypothetical protein